MHRTCLTLLSVFCLVGAGASAEDGPPALFGRLDRTILREPDYDSEPRYCLLLLGAGGAQQVWMVEDGQTLYLDRNANLDLTDDGPPLGPSSLRQYTDDDWAFQYLSEAAGANAASPFFSDFTLHRWNHGDASDSYGLSLTLERGLAAGNAVARLAQRLDAAGVPRQGRLPMYAGWFGTFWSGSPETAPVIHFGGALTPKMLREKQFVIGSGQRRLSICFVNPGSQPGATSRLSIDAPPPEAVPRLKIDWPAEPGGAPLTTVHELPRRCCYWEFYTEDFQVPAGVAAGSARVTVSFPGYEFPVELTTTTIAVPVLGASASSESSP